MIYCYIIGNMLYNCLSMLHNLEKPYCGVAQFIFFITFVIFVIKFVYGRSRQIQIIKKKF